MGRGCERNKQLSTQQDASLMLRLRGRRKHQRAMEETATAGSEGRSQFEHGNDSPQYGSSIPLPLTPQGSKDRLASVKEAATEVAAQHTAVPPPFALPERQHATQAPRVHKKG
eukprot:1162128-Pelagomonas_calceolata.AAC.10